MSRCTVDTCHSRWIFDPENRRFRRIPKGPGLASLMAVTEWRPYHELHLDPGADSFVVVLNVAGTRMLRSWRHTGAVCPRCGIARGDELSARVIAG